MHRAGKHSERTDTRVIADIGALAPKFLLGLCRLRLFVRIIRTSAPPIITVLYAARSSARPWLTALRMDIAWLASNTSKLGELRGRRPLRMDC